MFALAFKQFKDRADGFLAIIGLVALGFGAPYWLDNHYARASEVYQLRQDMKQYQLENKQLFLQQMLSTLVNKYKDQSKMSPTEKGTVIQLQNQLNQISIQLNNIYRLQGVSP